MFIFSFLLGLTLGSWANKFMSSVNSWASKNNSLLLCKRLSLDEEVSEDVEEKFERFCLVRRKSGSRVTRGGFFKRT